MAPLLKILGTALVLQNVEFTDMLGISSEFTSVEACQVTQKILNLLYICLANFSHSEADQWLLCFLPIYRLPVSQGGHGDSQFAMISSSAVFLVAINFLVDYYSVIGLHCYTITLNVQPEEWPLTRPNTILPTNKVLISIV